MMQRWYCSQTTGKVYRSIFGVIREVFVNFFKKRFADFRWKVVWLYV
jgi:hypothetical protein